MPRKNLFPYVKLRQRPDGSIRPRFEPGPRERALGYEAEDLKTETGAWMSLDGVAVFARMRLAEIVVARKIGKKPDAPPAPVTAGAKSVGALLDAYFASDEFRLELKPKTQQDYRLKSAAIRWRPMPDMGSLPGSRRERAAAYAVLKRDREPEEISLAPAHLVRPAIVKAFFNQVRRERGHGMALGAVRVLSAAYSWASTAIGWELEANPCLRLKLQGLAPDLEIFTADELRALRLMGDATGDDSIVDGALLGLLTGQRPTDILEFTGGGVSDGIVRLIQSKTGKRIELPAIGVLVDRLERMAARRRDRAWTCAELVVDDQLGTGFAERRWNERWRALVEKTAAGDAALGLEACPSIARKKFKYLRKTAFTWLSRAGNDLVAVGSVSGHSPATIAQMAKHYLAIDADAAAGAMGKLEAWIDAKGMKL